ncbi:amino acid permease [Streptomyces spongiae]|uniref:Amino acid permease n=1 Tax=Streptomyces spongiae TaxID=565072 RepID=A0A5N8XDY8_9ACTN|nr:amino acid permease [Streptomyces spongiae]MPY57148.1 amino acid permease [Streptomyces spongiae]
MTDTRAGRPGGGLDRSLGSRQIMMLSIGGALGTGLFLGASLAMSMAGPSVVVLYLVGAVFAAALAYALAEMASAHPEAGGFGWLADRYLGPLAGYVQRWSYWGCLVVTIGGEIVAAGIYLRFWWPELPLWIPVVALTVLIAAINCAAVSVFGELEYWFALIKVLAVVLFIGFGVVFIFFGVGGEPAAGLGNWTEHGGFAPHGAEGMLLALTVTTLAYGGTEAVAMTAAESKDPGKDVPRAARGVVLRLLLFYVLGTAVIVSVMPWTETANVSGVDQSPFVRLFDLIGVPAAAALMNAVVLTAALSAANTNLYVASRMMHSLALSGFAPRALGRTSSRRTPLAAVLASAVGLVAAAVVSAVSPEDAFPVLLGAALFTGMATWLIIFATHLAYRRSGVAQAVGKPAVRLPGAPVTTLIAMAFTVLVMVLTGFVDAFSLAWKAGVPFIVVVALSYMLPARKRRRTAAANPPAASAQPSTNAVPGQN